MKIISRRFFCGSHQFRKLGIWSGKKSGRRVKLHNFAIAHDKNTITCDDCLQPMSNHKYSTVRELVLQGAMHRRFSLRINGGCGFIQNQHLRKRYLSISLFISGLSLRKIPEKSLEYIRWITKISKVLPWLCVTKTSISKEAVSRRRSSYSRRIQRKHQAFPTWARPCLSSGSSRAHSKCPYPCAVEKDPSWIWKLNRSEVQRKK